jgi:hypothetical protein
MAIAFLLGVMRYLNIVVSLESLEVPRELDEAKKLIEPGGTIHLIYTLSGSAELEPSLERLRGVAAAARGNAQWDAILHLRRGARDEETGRLAAECYADLVVFGVFEPGASKLAAHVLSLAACSVLVLAPNKEHVEAAALVPEFSLCQRCVEARKADRGWFCAMHDEPKNRIFAKL